MEWYPLRDEVASFLGDRDTTIFAHAVSTETACIVCSTFFRRILVDSGEDPDRLELNARTQALVAFGRELGRDQGRVPAAAYAAVAELLSPPQVVALVAFGAMMVATNIVVNALDIDLDDYLEPYRRPGGVK